MAFSASAPDFSPSSRTYSYSIAAIKAPSKGPTCGTNRFRATLSLGLRCEWIAYPIHPMIGPLVCHNSRTQTPRGIDPAPCEWNADEMCYEDRESDHKWSKAVILARRIDHGKHGEDQQKCHHHLQTQRL